MNWGNVQIKLEPFNEMVSDRQIDIYNFVDAHGSSGGSVSNDENRNKIVPSKISRSKSNRHCRRDGHVNAIKENPIENVKNEHCSRYHPYMVQKRDDDCKYNASARNQFVKDRRSARRILEERNCEPLLGKIERVIHQYIVSVEVDGCRYFGFGRSFNEAKNDAARNAVKSIHRR